VVLPVDCISHHAEHVVKQLCRRQGSGSFRCAPPVPPRRSRAYGGRRWRTWRARRIDQTPTITSEALITAVAFPPGFNPSSSDASLVIEAVIVTVGDTSMVTWVVVAPGFTVLIVPEIWLRAESFTMQFL
jgi:hypothetical protein